jgi:hypothetical protein
MICSREVQGCLNPGTRARPKRVPVGSWGFPIFFCRPIRLQPHVLITMTTAMESSQFQSEKMTFSVLSSSAPVMAPRVGKLALAGRKTLSTPHYIPLTSRGTVPHIAHDMLRKETALNSLYIGLEDCTCYITPTRLVISHLNSHSEPSTRLTLRQSSPRNPPHPYTTSPCPKTNPRCEDSSAHPTTCP